MSFWSFPHEFANSGGSCRNSTSKVWRFQRASTNLTHSASYANSRGSRSFLISLSRWILCPLCIVCRPPLIAGDEPSGVEPKRSAAAVFSAKAHEFASAILQDQLLAQLRGLTALA